MSKALKLILLGVVLGAGLQAAVITPYYDQGAFNSALGSYTAAQIEDFSGVSTLFHNITPIGGSQAPVIRGIAAGVYRDQVDNGPLQTTTISRIDGAEMYAAGALWSLTLGGVGKNVVITLNLAAGGTQTLEFVLGNNVGDYSGPFYFGFTSTEAFTSFTLSAGNGTGIMESYTFDDLVTASFEDDELPSVPEPSSFGLMGMAMAGLGLFRRLRR